MLAIDGWNNVLQPLSVLADSQQEVSPLDALVVINEINSRRYSDSFGRLPDEPPAGERPPYFDVNCNGTVDPLDVLLVVNHLNGGPKPLGWTQAVIDTQTGAGSVSAAGCSPQLNEGNSFRTELVSAITLPNDHSAVQVSFMSPAFDTFSQMDIRDAFEIELTDQAGNPIAFPFSAAADASFNWNEGLSPIVGTGVEFVDGGSGNPSSATVPLSGLAAGTRVQLHLRLVNNDGDDGTFVRIQDVRLIDATTAAPTGASLASPTVEPSPVDFGRLQNVTGGLSVRYGRTTLSADDDRLLTDVEVTNVGGLAYRGPLVLALKNFSSIDVSALRPDGFTPEGQPYFQIGSANDLLRVGQTSRARAIGFLNGSGQRFDYQFEILARVNAAPRGFTSLPNTVIEAGTFYSYTAVATDPDGDSLSYSIETGPDAASIDAQTGVMNWSSTVGDLGLHRITIRATDSFGLYAEQTFELSVVESLQNRPPNFVSDPVTDAIASSGFEITTVRVGDAPSGTAIIAGFQGPRLVSIHSDDQTLGVYAGENNDRFDEETIYATGHPRPTESLWDVGISVDVGLPPFAANDDTNSVSGLAQGDLNGDGFLDLVAMVNFDSPARNLRRQWQIAAVLGDGNGGFGDPIIVFASSFSSSFDNRNLMVRDLNGDGSLDVIAVERVRQPRIVTILGNGDGTFQPPVEQTFSRTVSDFTIADINEDGVLDLIGRGTQLSFGANYEAIWMPGAGDGTFAEPIFIAAAGGAPNCCFATQVRPLDVADLNNDGHLDLAIAGSNASIQIYHNDGTGTFTLAADIDPPGPAFFYAPDWLRIGDFTGDGLLDIAYFHVWDGGRIDLMVGDGSGVEFVHQQGNLSGRVDNWAGGDGPVDVDGDGDLDLVMGGEGGNQASPIVFLNDGQGRFRATEYPMVDFLGHLPANNAYGNDIARGALFGDYNRDGVIDFSYFTSGSDFNGVGIRFGTRAGEFGSTRSLPADAILNDTEVHPADFDGDGDIDLLSLPSGYMSLGLGDGTFAEPFPAIGVSRPGSFGSIADFNSDGLPDVLATRANTRGSRYYVALSNGDGTFTVSDENLVESSFYGYSATEIADFNNDGYPDFVAKTSVERQIDVHLNDPENPGVFARSFRITLPPEAQGINVSSWEESFVPADFTGDGIVDLAFASRSVVGTSKMTLVIYAGDGDGNFAPHSELEGYDDEVMTSIFGAQFYYPGDYSAGDVDGDGDIDLISGTTMGPRVFLNQGDGSFRFLTQLNNYSTDQRGRDSDLIDFDADGILDYVESGYVSTPLNVRLGRGDGTFEEGRRVGSLGDISLSFFADVDHDGHQDVVQKSQSTATTLLAGIRDGLVDLLALDLNNDGNQELITVQQQSDRLQIFVGDNLGDFSRRSDLLTSRAPTAVAAGDLDGDGRFELLTANRAGRSISIFTGDLGSGYTTTELSLQAGPIDVLIADHNGDGFPDVLALDDSQNGLHIFPGNGTTTPSTPLILGLGDKPGRLISADATGDGWLDAIVTLPESRRVMILPGNGISFDFSAPIYLTTLGIPSDLAVLDLNEDGQPELAVSQSNSNSVVIYYGQGGGQFARPQLIAVGDRPTRIQVADADEDGRMDLVIANTGDATVSVIYNRFDPNEVYRYDADAIDPDDDALTYSIVDGPGGLIINASTGELLWAASPDQVGDHDVTIAANDGRGGIATQSFMIDVLPARENAAPLFATEPKLHIGAGESFEYQARALDNDEDPLRYRLIDGPDGATVDPTTGLIQWDARPDAAAGFRLPGDSYLGAIVVPADATLQTASLTVEGWYNFSRLPAFNGAAIIFEQTNQYGNAYQLWNNGNTRLRLEMQLGPNFGNNNGLFRAFYDFVPQTDRWYHFALTIDDASRTAHVYVDGELLGTSALPGPIFYSGHNAQVGDAGQFAMAGRIESYRQWNFARTADQIREGLGRQYSEPAGPAGLVLDYRFESESTRTVVDHSPANNYGYRVSNGLEPQWVDGLATPGLSRFVIAVEDGRGGFDTQSFNVEIVPELRGSIIGHLFNDLDGDGVQDDGSENPTEPSLEGWQLFIDANGNGYPDPDELQSITDAQGNYRFERLLPGEYPVRLAPVAGYAVPTTATTVSVDANGETTLDQAIQQLSLSHIRGQLRNEMAETIAYWKVFADLDDDGLRDENEPMAISDRTGSYALTGLAAGSYKIRPELPAGWTDTAGRDGLTVALAANEIATGNDFTLTPSNTSVSGGAHFVTQPPASIEARQTFRYAAVAMSIANEAIVYDLSLAPDGMTVDSSTGLTAWRPTIEQLGEHLVILRATSASGSISLQDFYIQVNAPNTAPVIVSESAASALRLNAYVGMVYAYDVIAQDAESTTLTYSLSSAPTGATINEVTGRLSWTPASSAVGSHEFTVVVTDEGGAKTTATWTVDVQNGVPATLPLNVTLPRSTAAVTVDYFSRIRATDAIGRPVTWTLVSGPDGMTVEADGTIQWAPAANHFGSQTIELRGATPDGSTEIVFFDIEVTGRSLNAIPSIDSEPITSVSIGQTFSYDLIVSDTDQDIFAFTLLEAPVGMSVHPSLGTVRWTPAADQQGESKVVVQVSDPSGATATQEFKLNVSRFGGPPRIVSVPPTEAGVGSAFLYSVVARDREGDPLTYTLLAAPAGMSIVETTGEIVWTPTIDQVGLQDVVIQVSDGIGGAVTQAFAIRVAAGIPNLPPQITSTSPRFGAVGTTYIYTLTATDPEGTLLRYSLGQSPAEMTIDPVTGTVEWTPTQAYVGKSVVTLIATDAGGASAIESFEFDVLAQNTAPVITSMAPIDVAAGALFMYDVLASDANLDQLTFELTQAPVGARIDSFGRIRWETDVSLIGAHDFVVKVQDPRGGQAMQSFTLDVIEDTVAPEVSIIENLGEGSRNVLPWQGPFIVFVRAIDNVAIASLTLTANGRDIPLDTAGTAKFTFDEWGFVGINATATATDTNGNVTSKTIFFDYDFPEGWGGGNVEVIPRAIITSPADTQSVSGMVSIVGTAAHDDFAAYKLSYRRADEDRFIEFFESTAAVTDGELGIWDTSLLLNDEYVLRLEVATNAGVVNVVEHHVGLAGELKLGNFRLSFTDMVIPVAGIPIEITRIYDTLQADREGDFGYGWRLEYRNTDLRVGLPQSGLEDIGIYSALRPGVKVYLNVPGQGRQGFTFNPDIRVLPGWGGNNLTLARPRFTPDPGVTSSLSTGISSYLQVNELGELYAPGGIPYNPASPNFGGAYVLTTREGITYRIDGASGNLQSATDRNGNRLVFSDDGIRVGSSNEDGYGIAIERDRMNRITKISDPNQNSVLYRYVNGDLDSSTDRNGNVTRFEYSALKPHYLSAVRDPFDRVGVRTNYSEAGRLESLTDADGNVVRIDVDVDALVEKVTDALGNESYVAYDMRGNKILSVDPLGQRSEYRYDTNNFLLASVNPLGETIEYTRSRTGKITTQTDDAGFVSRFALDANDLIVGFTDSLGSTTQYVRDARGNLIQEIDPAGAATIYNVDSSGNVIQKTDALGGQTEIVRNSRGWILQVENELGEKESRSYDASGRLIRANLQRSVGGETIELTTSQTYDAAGNVTRTVGPDGKVTEMEYDSGNQLVRSVDNLGRETVYERNSNGELKGIELAGQTLVSSTFDTLGRRTSSETVDGQLTTYEYDQLGRAVRQTTTDGSNSVGEDVTFSYDALGRVTQVSKGEYKLVDDTFDNRGAPIQSGAGNLASTREFDAAGRLVAETIDGDRTEYQYDNNDRITHIKYSDGSILQYEFNAAGELLTERLDGRIRFRYDYDSAGQMIGVIDGNGSRTSYSYDEVGNLTRLTDALGRETAYDYTNSGNMAKVTLPNGSAIDYEYDSTGRLITKRSGTSQVSFTYDGLDRIASRQESESESTFVYDAAGRLVSMIDERGSTDIQYDSFNRVIQKMDPTGAFIRYTYDRDGNIASVATPSGIRRLTYNATAQITTSVDVDGGTTVYDYDDFGRLVSTLLPNGIRETLTYRDDGQIETRSIHRGEEQIFRIEYQYDRQARLIAEIDSDGTSAFYEYSNSGYLTREFYRDSSGSEREIRYLYDAVGNRLDRNDSLNGVVRYEYNSMDQLVAKTSGADRFAYRYDDSGNLIEVTRNDQPFVSYRWSSAGRLLETRRIVDGIEQREEYLYDPQGIRVGTVRDGVAHYLLTDSNGGLSEVVDVYDADGEVVQSVSQGAGVRYSKTPSGGAYSIQDLRGSLTMRFDAAGNLIEQNRYDAFGRNLQSEDSQGFLGEWSDEVSELVYLRSRYYSSDDGRFLSTDPLRGVAGLPITQHKYAYAGNDPINQFDPTGMSTLAEQLATLTIKNRLFQVGIVQGLVGAISLAFNSSIRWSGPVYQIGYGDYKIAKSNFDSQSIGGEIGSVAVLTLYKEIGASASLLETLSKRAKAAKEKRLEENFLLSKALFGKRSRSANAARRDLKAARNEGTYQSPEDLLGFSVGDADIYTPAWMGHTGYSMTGAYLGGSLSVGASLTGGNADGVGVGAGGSIAIAAAVYGFGVGFSFKDTSKGISVTDTQNGAWLPDLQAGFSVSVGVSIPSYTSYRQSPK